MSTCLRFNCAKTERNHTDWTDIQDSAAASQTLNIALKKEELCIAINLKAEGLPRLGTWYLVVAYRGNGGIHRGIYQLPELKKPISSGFGVSIRVSKETFLPLNVHLCGQFGA
jgi:hypothetical protein